VQTVDWYDCVKWCNARSEQAGKTPVYYTDAGSRVYRTGEVTVYANWRPTVTGCRRRRNGRSGASGLSGKRFPWGDTISQKQATTTEPTAMPTIGPNGYNAIGSVGGTHRHDPVGSFAPNGMD